MKLVVVDNPRPLTIEHYNDVANAPLSASLNSGYALAVAREAGWETAYLDFSSAELDEKEMAQQILAQGGDLVLWHWVYSWGNEDAVASVVRMVKREIPVAMGAFGLFPTLTQEKLCSYLPQLDFVMVGEFEETLRALLTSIRKDRGVEPVPGLLAAGRPFARRPVIEDISSLPIPDDVGTNGALQSLNVAASRGCFGCCSFCFITTFYGCQRRRVRSISSLERELEARCARKNRASVYFIDPSFIGYGSGQREHAVTVSRLLKARGMTFGFETRVDTVTAEVMQTLSANGATDVFLGIESGCDAALRRMNKKITKDAIVRAVRSVQDAGINLSVGFIMFEPDTTPAELLENYRLLEQLDLLTDASRTVNLLYHSQIVLYGSRSWHSFMEQGRLLSDPRLPFEANFTFKDEKVARVCYSMKRLATEYFLRSDELYRKRKNSTCETAKGGWDTDFDQVRVNELLKQSFLALLGRVQSSTAAEYGRLEERLLQDLSGCF